MSGGDKLERHKRGLITNAWFYLPLASAHCMLLLTTCFCLLHTSANRILLLTACFCLLHASAYSTLRLNACFCLPHASVSRSRDTESHDSCIPQGVAGRKECLWYREGREKWKLLKAP